MKEKKVTKEVFLIVFVIGLVVFLISYFSIYMNFSNKAEELAASNQQLRQEVKELKVHFDKMADYKTETKAVMDAILAICEKYPADAREEDAIMLAVNMQENSKVNYTSIEMTETQYIHAVAAETVRIAGTEDLQGEVVFAARDVSYLNATDYTNLKDCIRSIYRYHQKTDACIGIRNVHYTLNESNSTLDGIIDVTFYSIQGTGKEYKAPKISDYVSGKEDLFAVVAD